MNVNVIDKWNTENGISKTSERTIERARTAELAHHLSSVALREWEKALTGVVALPAAAALGVAATAMYGAAIIERGFEVFESAIGEVGRTLTPERDVREVGDRRERSADRPEARS